MAGNQNQTHLPLDEVELGGTGVHQSVEVSVAGELGLDQPADVSLEEAETERKQARSALMLKYLLVSLSL